jgi:hypothetical protein
VNRAEWEGGDVDVWEGKGRRDETESHLVTSFWPRPTAARQGTPKGDTSKYEITVTANLNVVIIV